MAPKFCGGNPACYSIFHKIILFVSKMDTHRDVEHESSTKRIKLDFNEPNIGELCNEKVFSCFSTPVADSIDISEGKIFKICFVV